MSNKKPTETPAPALAPLTPREEQLLDALEELQAEVATLKAGQTSVEAKQQTDAEKLTAELDAEYAELQKTFAGFSGIQVLNRRVAFGVEAGAEVRLRVLPGEEADKDGNPYWSLRWFNFAKDGRAWEAKQRGWEKVLTSQLEDPESVAGAVAVDEYVRRGDRGQEWLMRMPFRIYRYVKKREQLAREGKLSSESATKDYLANKVATEIGQTGGNADQAGSFVAGKAFTVDITEGPTERGVVPA